MNKINWYKPFPITSICREDLAEYFTDRQIASLDDSDMARIADKLSDAYMKVFWTDMRIIVEQVLKDKEEENHDRNRKV